MRGDIFEVVKIIVLISRILIRLMVLTMKKCHQAGLDIILIIIFGRLSSSMTNHPFLAG